MSGPIRAGVYGPREDVDKTSLDYPAVKVRYASYEQIEKRALIHQQDSGDITKDFLKYDEVPQITNFSRSSMSPGQSVDRHVHESKYEIFEVLSGSGEFCVWEIGADANAKPKETFPLEKDVVVTVGPKEPHSMRTLEDSDGPLVMTYIGIVAPEK
ncbi:unnamed protein product [Bathycoccus prasinos]